MSPWISNPEEGHGQRSMIALLDERAASNPQKTFISIPSGNNVTDGQRDISYAEMARAVNRCAWWIVATLGKGVDFQPIATYMAPMDIRHPILTLGSIKAGYKVRM